MNETQQLITAVINSLNLIEVKGETNLILLANSITTLKKVKEELNTKEEKINE